MSDLLFPTMNELTPILRSGDLDACERMVVERLRSLPDSPFHCAPDLHISNDPKDAASHFDRFIESQSSQFQIACIYTEMNGFDINPDRWYCDLFAYATYGGHDDYDWLSDWQSDYSPAFQIDGLEQLQEVYGSEAFEDLSNEAASSMSSLLVVVMFQKFIQRAVPLMKSLSFPLLATAHEYDFIAEFGTDRTLGVPTHDRAGQSASPSSCYEIRAAHDVSFGVANAPEDVDPALLYDEHYMEDWASIEFTLADGKQADWQDSDTGWAMCSEKLHSILDTHISSQTKSQWLPVKLRLESGQILDYYVLHLFDRDDLIDPSSSVLLDDGSVITPHFDADQIGGRHVFSYPGAFFTIYVSTEARNAIQEAECTGLAFDEIVCSTDGDNEE